MRAFVLLSLAFGLAACGPSAGPGAGPDSHSEACALIGAPDALFGAGAIAAGDNGMDDMAGYCRFQSADGVRTGEIVLYTAASLRAVKPADRFAETIAKWDTMTETPLAAIEGVGEAAQIATDLPGYQTQIAFTKGDKLVLISANSGDTKITGEAIARAMAKAAAVAE